MAFVSVDFAIDTARKHKCNYWRVMDSDGSQIATQQDDTITIEDSLSELADVLNTVTGAVVVRCTAKSPKELGKGGDIKTHYFTFKISGNAIRPIAERHQAPVHQDNHMLVKFYELQKEMEIMKLTYHHTQELERIKRDKGSRQDDIMKEVLMMMRTYATSQAAPVTAPVAIGNTAPPANIPQEGKVVQMGAVNTLGQRITTAMRDLSQVDGEAVESLEALAHFAKNHPEQYRQYLSMLKTA